MLSLKKWCSVALALAMIFTISTGPEGIAAVAAGDNSSTPVKVGMNLVKNGSFDNNLDEWVKNTENGITAVYVPQGGRNNSGAAQITITRGTAGAKFYQAEKIKMKKNVLYEVSVWVKMETQAAKDRKYSIGIVSDTFAPNVLPLYNADGTPKGTSADQEYEKTLYLANRPCSELGEDWTQIKGYYRYNGTHEDASSRLSIVLNKNNAMNEDVTYLIDDFTVYECQEPESILIDYTQDKISNPWVSNGLSGTYASVVSMIDHNGQQNDVLAFKGEDNNRVSELFQQIRFKKGVTYRISFYAKLAENTKNVTTDYLQAIISFRGFIDTNTGYPTGPQAINTSDWTYVNKYYTYTNFAQEGGGNFFFRMQNNNDIGYYVDDLKFEEAGIVINGTFDKDISGWNDSRGVLSWYPNGADDTGGCMKVALDPNGSLDNNNIGWGQFIRLERECWYRFSAKVKLTTFDDSIPPQTITGKAHIYLKDLAERKFNPSTNDWSWAPYMVIAENVPVNSDNWTTVQGYYKYSGMEFDPRDTSENPAKFSNSDGNLEIRVGDQNTKISFLVDDVKVDRLGYVANGDFEDEYYKSIRDAYKGRVGGATFATKFVPYDNMSLVNITAQAAHSGQYGAEVNLGSNKPISPVLKQYVHFELGQWYAYSAWIKVKDMPQLADNQRILGRMLFGSYFFSDKDLVMQYDPDLVNSVNSKLETSPTGRDIEDARIDRILIDAGTQYPAAADLSDGEWHLLKGVFNSRYFVGSGKYPGLTFEDLNATVAAGYLFPRVQIYTNGVEDTVTPVNFYYDDLQVFKLTNGTINADVTIKGNFKANENVLVEVKVTNTTTDNIDNLTVFVPVYSSDNRLMRVAVKTVKLEFPANHIGNPDKESGFAYFRFPMTIEPQETGGHLKVLVWDGGNAMRPLAPVKSMDAQQ